MTVTLISISASAIAPVTVSKIESTVFGRNSQDWKGMLRWASCNRLNTPNSLVLKDKTRFSSSNTASLMPFVFQCKST